MAADGFQFAFTPEVEASTAPAWEKVKHHVTPMEWRVQAPLIAEINRLKREKNAVILAHNYMTPEIFHGVSDIVGDSLALAREAIDVEADVIVLAVPLLEQDQEMLSEVADNLPTERSRVLAVTTAPVRRRHRRPDTAEAEPKD